MTEREDTIERIERVLILTHENSMTVTIPRLTAERAVSMLKEQEESIPVSWLTEKLEGHPELSYAVTDGINNVLDLWEGR